eukprot:PhF_6_TR9213/c5_g1_i2/m.14468
MTYLAVNYTTAWQEVVIRRVEHFASGGTVSIRVSVNRYVFAMGALCVIAIEVIAATHCVQTIIVTFMVIVATTEGMPATVRTCVLKIGATEEVTCSTVVKHNDVAVMTPVPPWHV